MTTLEEPTVESIRAELDVIRQERDMYKAQVTKAETALGIFRSQNSRFLVIVENLSRALNREPGE